MESYIMNTKEMYQITESLSYIQPASAWEIKNI